MANSYADDIKVKISEKYKPPCRISMPMSYSQRLTLNKQLQDNSPHYDFQLERAVLGRIRNSKESRKDIVTQRRQRLKLARNEFDEKYDEEKKQEQLESEQSKLLSNKANCSQNYITKNGILMPIPVTSGINSTNNILIPTPSSVQPLHSQVKPFNLSDFESDASPFDNMELKSINDLEELAQVLKSDKTSFNSYPPSYQQPMSYASSMPYGYNQIGNVAPTSTSYSQFTNQYIPTTNYQATSYDNQQMFYPQNSYSSYSISQPQKGNCKSVPDLVKSLENTHLTNDIREVKKHEVNIPVRPKSTDAVFSKNGDILNKFTREQKEICRNVSMMGFPLERVARVCELIGDDQKKIVDHLLALSELLDLGFSEGPASDALLKNNNDRDKALDFLVS